MEENQTTIVERFHAHPERLRQSILKRAFEGRLVEQDATDEPAERLLEDKSGETREDNKERER